MENIFTKNDQSPKFLYDIAEKLLNSFALLYCHDVNQFYITLYKTINNT